MSGTFLATRPAGATSVVALIDKSHHRIVIAADCRVNRLVSSLSECKIIEEPNCVVAIAGLYQEPATAFNLLQLVHTACQYAGNLREKADAFLRISRKPFETAVHHIQNADRRNFSPGGKGSTVEAVFAGMVRGRLTLLVRGLLSDENVRITTEKRESSDITLSPPGYFIGLNRHIREYAKPSSDWEWLGYREAARRFVEIEIRANPDLAGPPISELEIDDRGGVNWILRGVCETREAD